LRITIAKLPLAKDLDDFEFTDTPINETLVRDLAGGAFLAQQRNTVLVGGIGTGIFEPVSGQVGLRFLGKVISGCRDRTAIMSAK
jgi:hypothetical protein